MPGGAVQREGEMWRREWAPTQLTSEMHLCTLWRAGHPVELFSKGPEECKAVDSPLSRLVWVKYRGGWGEGGMAHGEQDLLKVLPGTLSSSSHWKDKGPEEQSVRNSFRIPANIMIKLYCSRLIYTSVRQQSQTYLSHLWHTCLWGMFQQERQRQAERWWGLESNTKEIKQLLRFLFLSIQGGLFQTQWDKRAFRRVLSSVCVCGGGVRKRGRRVTQAG